MAKVITPAELEKALKDPRVVRALFEALGSLSGASQSAQLASPSELRQLLVESLMTVELQTHLARLKAMRTGAHAGGQSKASDVLRVQQLVANELAAIAAKWFGPALKEPLLKMVAERDVPAAERMEAWQKEIAEGMQWIQERLKSEETLPAGEPSHCLLPRHARNRYHHEFCEDKRELARRVAATYFNREGVRCFLQASTFIAHLADEIKRQHVGNYGLFHTNSAIFPPALLSGAESTYQVYPVAGELFDDLCQGWYQANSDAPGKAYLRSLFHRADGRLEFALLTPQFMTADGRLQFLRLREAGNFANLIASNARHLVIVSPAARIFPDTGSLEASCGQDNRFEVRLAEILNDRRKSGEQVVVDVLVCGRFRDGVDPAAFESAVGSVLGASFSYCPNEKDAWRSESAPQT